MQLRGLAFNLPLDTTKVTFDVGTFAAGPALVAQGAESKATMGNAGVVSAELAGETVTVVKVSAPSVDCAKLMPPLEVA